MGSQGCNWLAKLAEKKVQGVIHGSETSEALRKMIRLSAAF